MDGSPAMPHQRHRRHLAAVDTSTPASRSRLLSMAALDAVCRHLAHKISGGHTYTGAEAGTSLLASVTAVVAGMPTAYDDLIRDPRQVLDAIKEPMPSVEAPPAPGTAPGSGAGAKPGHQRRVSAATMARRARLKAQEEKKEARRKNRLARRAAGRTPRSSASPSPSPSPTFTPPPPSPPPAPPGSAGGGAGATANAMDAAIEAGRLAMVKNAHAAAPAPGPVLLGSDAPGVSHTHTASGVPLAALADGLHANADAPASNNNNNSNNNTSSGTRRPVAPIRTTLAPIVRPQPQPPQQQPPPPQQPSTRGVALTPPPAARCPFCGSGCDSDDVFCAECGRKVSGAVVFADAGLPPRQRRDSYSRGRSPPPPSDLARRLSQAMGTSSTSASQIAGVLATPDASGDGGAGGGASPSSFVAGRTSPATAAGVLEHSEVAMPSLEEILDGLAVESKTPSPSSSPAAGAGDGAGAAGARRRGVSPSHGRRGGRQRSGGGALTVLPTPTKLANYLAHLPTWSLLQWDVGVVGSRRCRKSSTGGVFVQFKLRSTVSWPSHGTAGGGRDGRVTRSAVVYRRFRDFLWLVDCLAHRCKHAMLPLLPARPKDNHDKFSRLAVARRRSRLSLWLRLVKDHPVWRYSPELTAFLLADQRTFADVRHVANARSVAKIIAQPSLVTADSDARAWGIGDEVDLAASGQPQVLTSVPRAMGGATALLNECVAAPTPPPGHAVMGGVISRTTALKSMLQASASLVAAMAATADAEAALGSALASLSSAFTLSAPTTSSATSDDPSASAAVDGHTPTRRRAASAATFRSSIDFAQAVGDMCAPGRSGREAALLQQPSVDELSFWASQVFGSVERTVTHAVRPGASPPPGILANVAWLEAKCSARVVHTCARFASCAASGCHTQRRAWLQVQRTLRAGTPWSYAPPMDLLVDRLVEERGGADPTLSRLGVCDRDPVPSRHNPNGTTPRGVGRSPDPVRSSHTRSRSASQIAGGAHRNNPNRIPGRPSVMLHHGAGSAGALLTTRPTHPTTTTTTPTTMTPTTMTPVTPLPLPPPAVDVHRGAVATPPRSGGTTLGASRGPSTTGFRSPVARGSTLTPTALPPAPNTAGRRRPPGSSSSSSSHHSPASVTNVVLSHRESPAGGGGLRTTGAGAGAGAGGTDSDGEDGDEIDQDEVTSWQDEEPDMPPPLGGVYAGIITLFTPAPQSVLGAHPAPAAGSAPRRSGTAGAGSRARDRARRAPGSAPGSAPAGRRSASSNAFATPPRATDRRGREREALGNTVALPRSVTLALSSQVSGNSPAGTLPSSATPSGTAVRRPSQREAAVEHEADAADTDDEDTDAILRGNTPTATAATGRRPHSAPLIPIIGREVCVGRAQAGNQIVIDDDVAVSGHHAIMHVRRVWHRAAGGGTRPRGHRRLAVTQVRLADVGSRNGTFVNGLRLGIGTRHGVVLKDGDVIALGQTCLQFVAMA